MQGVSNNSAAMTPLPSASDSDSARAAVNGDGALVVTSPGGDVVGTHSDPLPTVAIPVAVMPDTVEVAVIVTTSGDPATKPGIWSDSIASAGAWTAQKVETGRAVIDLDDDYRLSINDVTAEVILENRKTGVTTRIWGNAQVEVGGQQIGQFYGTSSFALANGTLITATTMCSPDNSAAFMLDKLVITRDEHGIVVTGIASTTVGDVEIAFASNATVFDQRAPLEASLPQTGPVSPVKPVAPDSSTPVTTEVIIINLNVSDETLENALSAVDPEAVTQLATLDAVRPVIADLPDPIVHIPAPPPLVENTKPKEAAHHAGIDGYDMDDDQRDGLVFLETASGWIDEWDEKNISADILAQTMPGGEFGPDSTIMSRTEFGAVISRFISILSSQSMMHQMANSNSIAQNQMRDASSDSDRQASLRNAEERAARDRRAMLTMMDLGIGQQSELLNRYFGSAVG